MSMTDAVKSVFSNYATFEGRARRSEFWYFVLFNLLADFVISTIGSLLGAGSTLGVIYAAAVFLPSLAVACRRLHDTGRSGAWILISLVPVFGVIIYVLMVCGDSQPGDNQYGPNPKEITY